VIVQIRPETVDDHDSIRHVNQRAFGGSMEADLVDALRVGGHVTASLVAESQDQIIGHILFSPVTIVMTAGTTEILSLAPMSVLPEHQRTGVGTALVEAGINRCREATQTAVAVLGHPQFYRRFGFTSELARSLKSPFGGGEEWMALELVPGSLQNIAGTVVYPPPFQMFE